MLKEFLLFELKYRARRPATYIYFVILLLISFLGVASDSVSIGDVAGKVYKNAPSQIALYFGVLSVVGISIISAMMSVPVYRDLEYKSHTFFYTLPFSKNAYLGGRFLGSFMVLLLIFTGISLGLLLGSVAPWADQERMTGNHIGVYLYLYTLILLPNLLFASSLFFALVALSRSIVAAYTGNILLMVGYILSISLNRELENQQMAALLDPFALGTLQYVTKYWTLSEQNSKVLAAEGLLLYNRLLWSGAALLLLAYTFGVFNLKKFSGLAGKAPKDRQAEESAPPPRLAIPVVVPDFSQGLYFKQLFSLARLEFTNIVRDIFFISILLAGIIFLLLDGWYVDSWYGNTTLPLTYIMLQIKNGNFSLVAYAILAMFTGELVWRERAVNFAQIRDAFPMPTWLIYGSKFLAIAAVCTVLVSSILLASVGVQTVKGFYEYDFSLYFRELYLITLSDYLLFAALCFFIHILVNNKFLGFFAITMFWVLMITLRQFDLTHPLYTYSALPAYIYSAMNGYGHYAQPLFWMSLYWALFALLLLIVGNAWWVRGVETGFGNRFRLFKQRWNGTAKASLLLVLLLWAGVGAWIFYNTNLLNTFRERDQNRQLQAEYERKYKKYQHALQPRLTQVSVNVDLFPEERRVLMKGQYVAKNKELRSIDTLHLYVNESIELHKLLINGKPAEVLLADKVLGHRILRISPALAPQQEMTIDMEMSVTVKGFDARRGNTQLVENGSFFNNLAFPRIGYDIFSELSDNQERKKQGLPPRERMPDLYNQAARQNTYIDSHADWIAFEATISTSADQIAIAPGYLQKQWEKDGRRYFRYSMEKTRILNFYSFISARYQLLRDEWKGANGQQVAIEIYYHPGHEYNLQRMVKGIKKSLDYFTANFSPYQHRQLRIIEFPRYARFAQSFPNTIPYSEDIGFILKVDKNSEKDLDMPFFVTAHEVAHQWWAHQVIGAGVQGATLMSESMAEYSALVVMEKEYGKEKMQRFLKYELDRYLRGRGREEEKEMPLYRVENQQYIHYNKGSIVLYALKDYIGEDKLNRALASYIDSVAFQQAPYTTSLEFISFLKKATPDTLQYLVEDLFEKITLYENRMGKASYVALGNNEYRVTLELEARKFYVDSLGNEKEQKMRDLIEVGIFAHNDSDQKQPPLYLGKHWLTSGRQQLVFTVKGQPGKTGIDPYHKLIDRNAEDNLMRAEAAR